jgi:hypothetical protein
LGRSSLDTDKPAASSGALLLGSYDESVVAYKDLRVVSAGEPARPGPMSRPIVLDGRAVGSWKRTAAGRAVTVEATLFAPLGAAELRALELEVERFGRFFGVPASLETRAAA